MGPTLGRPLPVIDHLSIHYTERAQTRADANEHAKKAKRRRLHLHDFSGPFSGGGRVEAVGPIPSPSAPEIAAISSLRWKFAIAIAKSRDFGAITLMIFFSWFFFIPCLFPCEAFLFFLECYSLLFQKFWGSEETDNPCCFWWFSLRLLESTSLDNPYPLY